jgi:hypothetical protein
MSDSDHSPVTLPLTGGCGCGLVRFEIDTALVAAGYCHCTRCQRRTGTGMQASARLAPNSLKVISGGEQLRGWNAGSGLEKVFCASCGSAVFARELDAGEIRIVRLGAIDGDPGVRPQAHQFVAYAAPWEQLPDDGLPRFDEGITGLPAR